MIDPQFRKQVEQATLATFQEEIPSIYFSDKTDAEFEAYTRNAAYTYRDLFKFPPRMFSGTELIDFGAGTGENTVSLARWGARCTLVEMNDKALAIARRVFERHAPDREHRFVHASIFDYEPAAEERYDIVHCRGVLSHTADKAGAFARIATLVRPGGFLIFGDPNKAGGFQNMLQRFAVYRFARTWDEMVEVCERLFKEDIDRSQHFVNRTRRAIIFDRWVIQSQDDPSIDEVLSWLAASGLRYYSSYPPFVMPLVGDSVHHRPKFQAALAPGMGLLAETVWMLQKDGDVENVRAVDADHLAYAERLAALTRSVENFNAQSTLDATAFCAMADAAAAAFESLRLLSPLQARFAEFMAEATEFVRIVSTGSVDAAREYILQCRHLFKGACGVRHVDFIAYRPE